MKNSAPSSTISNKMTKKMNVDAPDFELLGQIATGDSRSFRTLYARHKRSLMGFCTRMLADQPKAEEVAQEVWTRAVREIGSFSAETDFKLWLMTAARPLCLAELRLRRTWSEGMLTSELSEETLNVGNLSQLKLDEALGEHQELGALKKLIDELPDSQRSLLVLWMTTPTTFENLSRELGLPVSAVLLILSRATQKLEKRMRRS